MATLLKGKPVVDHMAVDLRSRIEALKSRGVEPTLALVRMGERPDDLSYERTAKKRAASLGLATKPYVLDDLAPQAAVQATLQSINYDKTVHGCLMFRPLPSFLDEKALCNMLSPEKDIDGISGSRRSPPCSPTRAMGFLLVRRKRAWRFSTSIGFPWWESTLWLSVEALWWASPSR